MPSIIAVPGITNTTPEFRRALVAMADQNGWDVDALASVMSSESRFNPAAKNPNGSASGIIQMIDATARSLGVSGGAAEVRGMSALDQLPLVEKYFQRAFRGLLNPPRRVDYYLALWGARPGQSLDNVLSTQGDPLYSVNRGLDVDNDGRITVSDLDAQMQRIMNQAHGTRIDIDAPLAVPGIPQIPPATNKPAPPPLPSPSSWVPRLSGASLMRLAEPEKLDVLRFGMRGADVCFVQFIVKAPLTGMYDSFCEQAVKDYQNRRGLISDGIWGVQCWKDLKG